MVCYTTRVDSRIPQDSSGSPRTSHDSLVRSARRTREPHIFVPTPLSKSWDDHVTWRSPTTIRPALWGVRGVPHRNFQQTFRRGYPPPIDVSKASVLHIESHPPSGGSLLYAEVRRGAPGRRGACGPRWPGSVLSCRAALDCVPCRALSAWVPPILVRAVGYGEEAGLYSGTTPASLR